MPPVPVQASAAPPVAADPGDCDRCRFAAAPTSVSTTGLLQRRLIGCVMHNVRRVRRGAGCANHTLATNTDAAVAQILARTHRIRRIEKEARCHG